MFCCFFHSFDSTWVIAAFVPLLLLFYWYRRPKDFPSGPRGLPLIGVLPFLGKYPERVIKKWSAKYGQIMSVRMGRQDWVFLNDYESINQALVKQHTKFSGRTPFALSEQITKGLGIVLVDYGMFWKSQRKFGLMTLRDLGVGKKRMENNITEEVFYLNEGIRAENEKPFNILMNLYRAVSNNICSVIFGKRFEYTDSHFTKIMEVLQSTADPTANQILSIVSFAPALVHIPPFSKYNKLFLEEVENMHSLIRDIIEEHEETFDENNIRDFIDAFLKEMKQNEDSSFSARQLLLYVADLFTAGTETTANTLYWSLLCLLRYPQTQTKLREEVVEVLGSDGELTMSNKADMPYTNAFIQEVLRYRTLTPLNLPHKTTENAELGGYFIPKDTNIVTNLWAVHNDPEIFNEPDKFEPERFLDEKGNYLPSNHVIPFSVGPRHCLGEHLARMEIFIFLVGMIQKFEFLPDPETDQLPEIDDYSNGLGAVPLPYKLVAKQY